MRRLKLLMRLLICNAAPQNAKPVLVALPVVLPVLQLAARALRVEHVQLHAVLVQRHVVPVLLRVAHALPVVLARRLLKHDKPKKPFRAFA